MAFKLIVLAALVAVAKAGILGAPAVLAPGAPLATRAYGAPLGLAGIGAAPLGLAGLGGIGLRGIGLGRAAIAAHAIAAAPIARAVAAPVAVAHAPVAVDTEYDPNPQYSYSYNVRDALTRDAKNQQESRSGDVVQGSYSLVEPDGTTRTVEYAADPVNGFNAVVHRTPAVAPVAAAPVAVAAPAIARVAAPVAVSAPAIARVAAPVAVAAAPSLAYGGGLGYAAGLGYAGGLSGHLAAKGLIG